MEQLFQTAQDHSAVVKGQSLAVLCEAGALIEAQGAFQGGGEDLAASLQAELIVEQARPASLPACQGNGEPPGIAGVIPGLCGDLVCVQDSQMGAAHDPGAGVSAGL